MHGVTKLFLGKKFNIKIRPPDTHAQTIEAFRLYINEEGIKRRLFSLLKRAEDAIISLRGIDDSLLPELLDDARVRTVRSQYYVNRFSLEYIKQVDAEADGFVKDIVLPYVKILEGMLA